jgi:hypothetical protein
MFLVSKKEMSVDDDTHAMFLMSKNKCCWVLWHIHPLLGNDCKTNK